MLHDIDGRLIVGLEPGNIIDAPAGVDWPPAVSAALAQYDATWEAWAEADTAREVAQAAIATAAEKDTTALREAVAAGLPDPGNRHQHEARRAGLYAQEMTRQAAQACDVAAEAVIDAVAANRSAVIMAVLAHERRQVDNYREHMRQAQAAALAANAAATAIGSAIAWTRVTLGDPYMPVIEVSDRPQVPDVPEWAATRIDNLLDRFEAQAAAPADLEPAGSAPKRTPKGK